MTLEEFRPITQKILNDLPWLTYDSVDAFVEDAVRQRIEKLLPLK